MSRLRYIAELALWLVLGLGLGAMLAGCWRSSEATREREQVRQIQWPGMTVQTPAGDIVLPPVEVRELSASVEREQARSRLELPPLPIPTPGGGLGGGLLGTAIAVGVAVWQWLRKRQIEQTARKAVAGLDEFQRDLPAEDREALHESLRRRMDDNDKARVRQLRS